MKRLLGVLAFLALSASPAMAQVDHFELSAGGSFRLFQQTETADESKIGMPGWYFSGVFNLRRFHSLLGLQLEGTGAYRHQGTFGDTSVYNLLAGPRVYIFGHHKLTPYGEVRFGYGYYTNDVPAYGGYSAQTQVSRGYSWEGGGGVELNLRHQHWAIRMMQFDFGQTSFFSYNVRQTNYRASIGVIYHFGRK